MTDPNPAKPAGARGHHQADSTDAAAALAVADLRQPAEAQDIQRISADPRRDWWSSAAGRELLRHSEYARLLARLETMPVVEQAKGIIMAQTRCGEAEAFDLLRRASQRSNIPVRDLAARLVAKTARTAAPAAGQDCGHSPAARAPALQ